LISQIIKNLKDKSQELDDNYKKNDGTVKSLINNLKNVEENFKELKEKNGEFDDYSRKYDVALKTIANNIKNVEVNFKDLKDCSSVIPNLSNDVGSLHKNIVTLNQNLNETVSDNTKKSKKIVEKLSEVAEENKAFQNRFKDIIMAIKNVDTKFEEKITQLAKFAQTLKQQQPEVKKGDEDFKQEIVTRLVSDEKKFIEIGENLEILDKNINLLNKKIEQIESNLNGPVDKTTHQAQCFAYNGCEVHSFRSNFILKGKDSISSTLEAKNMPKGKIFTEKENISLTSFFSKKNNIDLQVNNKNVRNSEKFQLNNLYLQCDPVNYINYSKNKLKHYLPKYYFSDKKAFVNIVEAYYEMNQDDFKEVKYH
jgi:DNA repair ATPase RecN